MDFLRYMTKRIHETKGLPNSIRVMRWIAIAGIAIGTAVLLVSLSVISGFRDSYKRAILDFNAHIVVLKGGEISDMDEAKSIFMDENGKFFSDSIIGMTPFMYREGMLISKGVVRGVVVKGIDPKTIRDVNRMKIDIFNGKGIEELSAGGGKSPRVVLGKALFDLLEIKSTAAPQYVTLMVPKMGDRKHLAKLELVGSFESGLYDYDSQFALMDIDSARELFNTGDLRASGIELKLDDPDKADSLSETINERASSSYDAITWGELNKDLFDALSLERIVFSIIMGTLVIVAAFNIIGVLVLLVYHRIYEIGILKSLGLKNNLLQKIFTHGGVKLGVIGSVLGFFVGILFSLALKHFGLVKLDPEIYFISVLPVKISWGVISLILVFSIMMCWITSNVAAYWGSKISITDALKGHK